MLFSNMILNHTNNFMDDQEPEILNSESSLDSSLWLNSQCQLLEKRQEEYLALSHELEMLNDIYNDMSTLTNNQQFLVDKSEQLITTTKTRLIQAENILHDSSLFYKRNIWLKTGLYFIIGSSVGIGTGGFGLLIGLKPAIAFAFGSGFGLFGASIAAVKI